MCDLFIRFGAKKLNLDGKGCDNKCNKLHPADMCRQSLKQGICERKECKFRHTHRTKFIPQKNKADAVKNQSNMNQQVGTYASSAKQAINGSQGTLNYDQRFLLLEERLKNIADMISIMQPMIVSSKGV